MIFDKLHSIQLFFLIETRYDDYSRIFFDTIAFFDFFIVEKYFFDTRIASFARFRIDLTIHRKLHDEFIIQNMTKIQ